MHFRQLASFDEYMHTVWLRQNASSKGQPFKVPVAYS